jgi:hypothetical protein
VRALLLAALLAAPAGAIRPLTPPAPEFPPEAAWINSKPLTLAMMRGRKAVLVVFLNPTGLHSIRALPALKAWFDRYALSQLMVIGVVTPDLEIQKDAAWVRSEVKRLGIDFPVVIDGDRRLWKSYANEGWPSLYVIDRKGRITFDHLGEGDYAETEREMREAVADVSEDVPDAVSPPEPRTKECGHATRDVPMGSRPEAVRAKPLDNDFSTRHLLLVESRERELTTRGKWDLEPDGLRLARQAPDLGDFVRVVFEATQALAVLGPVDGRKTRFFIKLDDQWLYEGIAGRDVRFDDDGRSFVEVSSPRLYDLIRDNGSSAHELYVEPDRTGGGVYGFEFADACVATQLP